MPVNKSVVGGLQLAGKTEQILEANRRTASDPHVKETIYQVAKANHSTPSKRDACSAVYMKGGEEGIGPFHRHTSSHLMPCYTHNIPFCGHSNYYYGEKPQLNQLPLYACNVG